MNKKIKVVLLVLAGIAVVAGSWLLYTYLTENYDPSGSAASKQSQPRLSSAVTSSAPISSAAEASVPTPPVASSAVESAAESSVPTLPAASSAAAASKPVLPDPSIDFKIYNADGSTVTLADLVGKPLVINLWASWCGPCRNEMPHFQEQYEKYGADGDVRFAMVNLTASDTRADADSLVKSNGYTFPIYYDINDSAASAFQAYSIPVTIFLDADGNVARQTVGSLTASRLNNYIDEIVNK